MIHLLTVDPTLTPQQLKKTARKLAMTGGFEVVLAEGLQAADLELLIAVYKPVVQSFLPGSSEQRGSTAYRILELIRAHPECTELLQKELCASA